MDQSEGGPVSNFIGNAGWILLLLGGEELASHRYESGGLLCTMSLAAHFVHHRWPQINTNFRRIRFRKPPADVPRQPSASEQIRSERLGQMRALLREAAAMIRADRVTLTQRPNQADADSALTAHYGRHVVVPDFLRRSLLLPTRASEYAEFIDSEAKKHGDNRIAEAAAGFLERLSDRMAEDELDHTFELPRTFREFRDGAANWPKHASADGSSVAPKTGSIKPAESLTIRELFKTEYSTTTIKSAQEATITLGGIATPITLQAYFDFPSRSKFIGYFLPSGPHTYGLCEYFAKQSDSTLAGIESLAKVESGFTGQRERRSTGDLQFTKQVVIYHEDNFSTRQAADLGDLYKSHGLDLVLRGPEYLSVKQAFKSLGGR